MAGPFPVMVRVCNTCGEDWNKHLRLAHGRVQDEFYSEMERGPDEWPREVRDTDVVDLDCIAILKRRFEGPMGPAGPMGAMGAAGADGRSHGA